MRDSPAEGGKPKDTWEKRALWGIKFMEMAQGTAWRMWGGEGAFFFFGWVWRRVMRRQMKLQSNLYTRALYLPISSLLLTSLKMASHFPLLNPLSTLLWHFLNPYPLWPDLLTVFGMVDQPCPLDSFSLFDFHDNGASWFSWWVFVTSFASFPPKLSQWPPKNAPYL